jgi:hypothetical protein
VTLLFGQVLAGPLPTPAELRTTQSLAQDATAIPDGDRLVINFGSSSLSRVVFSPSVPYQVGSGLSVTLTNVGQLPVRLLIRVHDDPSGGYGEHSRWAQVRLQPRKTGTYVIPFGLDPRAIGVRNVSSRLGSRGMTVFGLGPFNGNNVVRLIFQRLGAPAPARVRIDALGRAKSEPSGPIVDAAGRSLGLLGEPIKAGDDPRLAPSGRPKGWDEYGAWDGGPNLGTTGFFRVQKYRNRWTLVAPSGRPFFSLGVDAVEPRGNTAIEGRESLIKGLPPQSDAAYGTARTLKGSARSFGVMVYNLERELGAGWLDAWRDRTPRRLIGWGFNTIGAFSENALAPGRRIPHVIHQEISGTFARIKGTGDHWGPMADPFDPAWKAAVETRLVAVVARGKGDPWLIGYSVDNELSWGGHGRDEAQFGLVKGALALQAEASPAKRGLIAALRERYRDVSALNRVWGTKYDAWSDLDGPVAPTAGAQEDLSFLSRKFAAEYFGTIRATLRRLDPQHLYLGSRFSSWTPEAVQEAAKACDVVSFNLYAPKPDPAEQPWLTLDVPILLSEFHFGALDRGGFAPGLVDAGTQEGRAHGLQNYVGTALRSSNIVGCHWFQYADQPLTGRPFDGENFAIGLVDLQDRPYLPLVLASRDLGERMYGIRFGP